MFFFISAKHYVIMFFILIVLGALVIFSPLLIFPGGPIFYFGLLILNVLCMVFTWRYNTSPRLSFLRGLEIIASTSMSGCSNLTIIYIYPVLFMAYCEAAFNAAIGLFKGKNYTEKKWIEEVSKYEAISRFRW